MSRSTDLYWIAMNNSFDLSLRYAAARQLQRMKKPRRTDPRVGKECKHYTPSEERRIVEMRNAKVSIRDIANFFGRTESAVKSKIYTTRKVKAR